MGASYSEDLRLRVVLAVADGMSRNAAARHFSVGVSSAIRWVRQWQQHGNVTPGSPRGTIRSPLREYRDWLLDLARAEPDLILLEIQGRLLEQRGFRTSISSLWRFFERENISFKKTLYATEQHRTNVASARVDWRAEQPDLDPKRLVFLDETGTSTNMTRMRGRCARGERLLGYTPHGHWLTTTFVSGLRLSGIIAPLAIDCPMNARIFYRYVEACLAPELRDGDIVILDNLSSHKAAGVREIIAARGASLKFLPPYSPDLNPIEQAISKLKAHLRKAAQRTVDGVWTEIGKIIDTYTPIECANYFRKSGYRPT